MVGMNAVHRHGHQSSVTSQAKAPAAKPSSDKQQYADLNTSGKGDQANFNLISQSQAGDDTKGADSQGGNDQGDDNQGPSSSSSHKGKGHGCDKSDKSIPPGLAKKKASDLPDGNPWKAALEKRDQASAANQPPANSSDDSSDTAQADAADTAAPSQAPTLSLVEGLVELLNNLFALSNQSAPQAPATPQQITVDDPVVTPAPAVPVDKAVVDPASTDESNEPQTAPVVNATVVDPAPVETKAGNAGAAAMPVGGTGGDPATNPPVAATKVTTQPDKIALSHA